MQDCLGAPLHADATVFTLPLGRQMYFLRSTRQPNRGGVPLRSRHRVAIGALLIGASIWFPQVADAQTPIAPSRLSAAADSLNERSPHSRLTIVSAVRSVRPGQHIQVALRLRLDKGWHTYWINPGDAGLPLGVRWTAPDSSSADAVLFPTPRLVPQPPLMSYGYEGEVLFPVTLRAPSTLKVGAIFRAAATADWLACADVCLPAAGDVALRLPVVGATTPTADVRGGAAVDSALASLPAPPGVWNATARVTTDGYVISLVAKTKSRSAMPAPYFFVDSSGIVEHAKPQPLVRVGDTLRLAVTRSEFAGAPVSILRGILVADTANPSAGAWQVSAAVTPSTVSTKAGAAALAASATDSGTMSLSLSVALMFALLGGLLLNLMPCVFPVLSIKVLTFVEQGAHDPGAGRRHGLVFALGVLLTSWLLSAVLFALRAAGDSLGWGFQMQSPIVVSLLAVVMFALALNMSGVFEIGVGFTRLGGVGLGRRYTDSLLTGVLAVVVATPCTAPFMGAAIGFALVQPPLVGMLVLTSLAVGLALPYVVLSSFPALLRYLPRPGAWLESFKQLLAFPLYATVVWLVWVLGQQVGIDLVGEASLGLVVFALGGWLLGRSQRTQRRRVGALAACTMAGALLIALDAGRSALEPASVALDDQWEKFSVARVAALRLEGRPVFVDFTAAWCLSCQVNERVALRTDAVRQAFSDASVALLRADWTARDPDISAALAGLGRSGVPLYVLYPAAPAAPAHILPAVLTPGTVIKALDQLGSRQRKTRVQR